MHPALSSITIRAHVRDLQRADAIGCILHACRQLRDLARVFVSHSETGRVIGRGVDFVARRQLLDRRILKRLILADVILRV